MMSLFTRRKVIGLFRLAGLAVPFKFSPLLAAEAQAATNAPDVHLLSQDGRPPPSVPLQNAPLLPNVNWVRGNEARAEWTWAAQLADNPEAVPNNLGRYLVQIPGVFEKQLDYSTSLIFDTPSFRNGVQISGFVDRVTKELVTNAIAQRRRAWYTMTHHAFLGMQSALRYGTAPEKMAQKMLHLDAPSTPGIFERHERAAVILANKFGTDPQSYSDQDFAEFRAAFAEYNQNVYASVERPFLQLRAAREARAQALVDAKSVNEADTLARRAADSVPTTMPKDLLARKVNSQFVELCFHSMQFVGLAGVFDAKDLEAGLVRIAHEVPDCVATGLGEIGHLMPAQIGLGFIGNFAHAGVGLVLVLHFQNLGHGVLSDAGRMAGRGPLFTACPTVSGVAARRRASMSNIVTRRPAAVQARASERPSPCRLQAA